MKQTIHRLLGKGRFRMAILGAAACLLPTAGLEAATWHVEKDGSGDFTIIQDALNAASPGDSILIGPGRYDDFRAFDWTPVGGVSQAIIGIHKNNLTIVGADSAQVIIGPEIPVDFIDDQDAIGFAVNHELVGLNFSQLTVENVRWGGLVSGVADFTSCAFRNNSWSSLDVTYGSGMVYSRCSFEGKDVVLIRVATAMSDIAFDHCSFGPFGGLKIQNSIIGVAIRHCRSIGNGTGIQFSGGATGVVRDSNFSQNDTHLVSTVNSHVEVYDSRFDPGAGFALSISSGGGLEAHGNRIGGARLVTVFATNIGTPQQLIFTGNDIYNGGGLSVKLPAAGLTETFDVDFSNNYWGTTDTAQIDAWIEDDKDLVYGAPSRAGTVVYEPIRMSSVPNRRRSFGSIKSAFGSRAN